MRKKFDRTKLLARFVGSTRVALIVFLVSIVFMLACLLKESEVLVSYFSQPATWAPPLLVISSDDWGGDNPPETVEDLERIRNTLESIRDAHGHPLVLTAYINPTGPDFEKIAVDQYANYSYRYSYQDKPEVADKITNFYDAGILDIGFHGREHYNITLWLNLLQNAHPGFREACRRRHVPWRDGPGWDIQADPRLPFLRQSFVDASSYPPKSLPIDTQRAMLASGLALMETAFHVRPIVFTPPGYAHDMNTLRAMQFVGLAYIDSIGRPVPQVSAKRDLLREAANWDYGVELHGVRPIIRNVHFEPYRANMSAKEYLENTMKQVRRQLVAKRPLVISSHRWNYVKAVDPNRDMNLFLLRDLVRQIQDEAPDILFIGASDLCRHLYNSDKAKRAVDLKELALSGTDKIWHGIRCIWLGHERIRFASLLSIVACLWLYCAWVYQSLPKLQR